MRATKELIERVFSADADERRVICGSSFECFVLYYFSDFFTYRIPPFHEDFYDDGQNLIAGKLKEVVWTAFRESGKTTIAKMLVIWCIVYGKKKYINIDAYTKNASAMFLFDVITMLQTNEKLLHDWKGSFYNEAPRKDEKSLKRIEAFITANKIKVEAFSVGIPFRGRVYLDNRPDLVIVDDLENSETVNSAQLVQNAKAHIDEMRSGLSPNSSVLYIGNYISDSAVMRYVMDITERNPQGIVRNIPLISKGVIAWKDKYVMTDEEAAAINAKETNKKRVSVESLKRDLGETQFAAEMMNDPARAGTMLYDRRRLDTAMRFTTEPIDDNAGFSRWAEFNPSHRYGMGADTSEGVGRDANASVLIDFSQMPFEQVASYQSNKITPDIFGYELKRQGNMYGDPIIGVEQNNTGLTTLTVLKSIYPVDKIYRREEQDRIANKVTKKLGWRTTSQTKPEMMYALKTAVEEGKLIIRDERILKEMRQYGIADLSSETRHFDLLTACAIAFQMNKWAQAKETQQDEYKQRAYEPSSFFESAGYNEKTDELFQDNTKI
jgi:hypothetical protein